MARLDWDRLRRIQPLDGADPRVDPDGAILWEREMGPARDGEPRPSRPALEPGSGQRWLRAGVVVRRTREPLLNELSVPLDAPRPPPLRTKMPFDANAWVECPRCRAHVPRGKLLLHARAACTRRGASSAFPRIERHPPTKRPAR
jgi:hypothetical protein